MDRSRAPPECKETSCPHLSHLPENSTTFGLVLNYIVDQLRELKLEIDNISCHCINIENKNLAYKEELKKNFKELKEEVKQIKLALTHEVRLRFSQPERTPNRIVPFKYSYPF